MAHATSKKNFTPIHINVSKHPPYIVYGVKGVLLGLTVLAFLFLMINIAASQMITPKYFNFITENRKDAVDFLKEAQNLPDYKSIYLSQKQIYGDDIEQDVYQAAWDRTKQIQIDEELLQKNSNARDVLYELYVLFYKQGDMAKAQTYLERAKTVDPMVERELGH